MRFRLTKYWYACKIEETTDGRGCGACRQARATFQVISQRRFERNVPVDEQKRAAQNGQDQTQRQADEKATLKVNRSSTGEVRRVLPYPFCITAITCFKGSVLTLLVPVKGWLRT